MKKAAVLVISLTLMACGGSDDTAPTTDTGMPTADTAQPMADTAQSTPDTAVQTPDTAQPTPDTTACTPQCDGKECGPDNCGATCGTCPDNGSTCDANGQCTTTTTPSSGACTNANDQAIVDNQDVETIAKDCAIVHLTDADKAAECIKKDTGLSDPCIACFQGTVNCAIGSCAFQCLDASNPACDTCLKDNGCYSEFEECSGLSTTPTN